MREYVLKMMRGGEWWYWTGRWDAGRPVFTKRVGRAKGWSSLADAASERWEARALHGTRVQLEEKGEG